MQNDMRELLNAYALFRNAAVVKLYWDAQ